MCKSSYENQIIPKHLGAVHELLPCFLFFDISTNERWGVCMYLMTWDYQTRHAVVSSLHAMLLISKKTLSFLVFPFFLIAVHDPRWFIHLDRGRTNTPTQRRRGRRGRKSYLWLADESMPSTEWNERLPPSPLCGFLGQYTINIEKERERRWEKVVLL